MKISYDYENLIKELHQEIEDDNLSLDSEIQILREESKEYNPIVDWYYDENRMKKLENDIRKNERAWKLYLEDQPRLTKITVRECLDEMIEMNQIF